MLAQTDPYTIDLEIVIMTKQAQTKQTRTQSYRFILGRFVPSRELFNRYPIKRS